MEHYIAQVLNDFTVHQEDGEDVTGFSGKIGAPDTTTVHVLDSMGVEVQLYSEDNQPGIWVDADQKWFYPPNTTGITQPLNVSDTGYFRFYAEDGKYNVVINKGLSSQVTWTDQLLFDGLFLIDRLSKLEESVRNNAASGFFEFEQTPIWIVSGGTLLPTKLTNNILVYFKYEGVILSRKSFRITLDQTSKTLSMEVIVRDINDTTPDGQLPTTDDNKDVFPDLITLTTLGGGSKALQVTADLADKITIREQFLLLDTAIDIDSIIADIKVTTDAIAGDLSDVSQDVSDMSTDVDNLSLTLMRRIMDSENEFDYTIQNVVKIDKLNELQGSSITDITATVTSDRDTAALKFTELDSQFEDSQANLRLTYITKADSESALSTATTQLTSTVEDNLAFLKNNYTTTTDVDSAAALSEQRLTTKIDNNQAAIVNYYYTKTDADAAIAASALILDSKMNGNQATLVNNYYTKVNIDNALSAQRSELKSNIDGNMSHLTTYYYTKTDADSANSAIKQELQSEIETNQANLTTYYYTKTQTNSAISSSISQLRSVVDANDAYIAYYYYTKSDTDSAIASSAQTLTSATNNLAATLSNQYYTKTSTDSAIASSAQTLQSSINSVDAYYYQNYYSKASTDSAIASAVQSVQSNLDSVSSNVTQNYYTKVDADTKTASAVATLSSKVTSNTGNISSALVTLSSHTTTIGEVYSRAFLGVDSGGAVTGISIDGNTRILNLKGAAFQFSNTQNVPKLYFDGSTGKLTVKGHIEAESGSFAGTLNSATGTFKGRVLVLQSSGEAINASTGGTATCISGINLGTGTGIRGSSSGGIGVRGSGLGSLNSGSYGVSGYCNYVLGNAFYAEQGTYGPFTGSHDGLFTKSYKKVEQGDIVVIHKFYERSSISDSIWVMRTSSKKHQKAVAGVFIGRGPVPLELPIAALSDQEKTGLTHDLIKFNAVGEGSVNVCGENGDIEIGDLITTSSMNGKGMKQDDDIYRSYTLGKANEGITFDSPEQVKQVSIFYSCA